MAIRHVVSWKIAADDPDIRASQIAAFKAALEALPTQISQIKNLQVGVNSLREETNWHLTLIVDLESAASLEAYDSHPAHLEVVAGHRHIFAARAAVDFEF
ncbi:Dabb family protein [Lysinibacter sp. HNR]|uniref:Dabb family protein n=1 Tax=Lysinibacter sp. HNR TaxID=3031408 RepID=UPI0024358FF6|nr:Dabb family protein [Lysinibacter sp. HNR]WGD37633.1 Dabb family protein [Lysinibacter sp. HNR]